MKESNFYSDEFEQLIREKTEQYKMYPSENVWKGVHNSLHTKRKWFIGSMSLLVTGILFFAGRELLSPSVHPELAMKTIVAGSLGADIARTITPAATPHAVLTAFRPTPSSSVANRHSTLAGIAGGEELDQSYKGITITLSNLVISQPDLSEFLSHMVRLRDHAPALPVTAALRNNSVA